VKLYEKERLSTVGRLCLHLPTVDSIYLIQSHQGDRVAEVDRAKVAVEGGLSEALNPNHSHVYLGFALLDHNASYHMDSPQRQCRTFLASVILRKKLASHIPAYRHRLTCLDTGCRAFDCNHFERCLPCV